LLKKTYTRYHLPKAQLLLEQREGEIMLLKWSLIVFNVTIWSYIIIQTAKIFLN